MKISRADILHVGNLARLEMDEESIEKFTKQAEEILEYVNKLNDIDTEGVVPTSHAIFLKNAFREDAGRESFDHENLLKNAPEKEGGNFIVPKVIE